MRLPHWLRPLATRLNSGPVWRAPHRGRFCPRVEGLEDRTVPASRFSAIDMAPGSAPDYIVSGPDGGIWFTELGAGKIARIDPSTNAVQEFASVVDSASGYRPQAIIAGPDRPDGAHTIWFSELQYPGNPLTPSGPPTGSKVVEMTTVGTVLDTYTLPSGTEPLLAFVPGRNTVWFDDYWSSTVGEIAPGQGVVGTIQVETGTGVGAIVADPVLRDGHRRIWFAESYPYGVLKWVDLPADNVAVNSANVTIGQWTGNVQGLYEYYATGRITDLVFGPDGDLWGTAGSGANFTNFGTLLQINPTDGSLVGLYGVANGSSSTPPYTLVSDPGHNSLWSTQVNSPSINQTYVGASGAVGPPSGSTYPTTALLGQVYTDYTGISGTSIQPSYGGSPGKNEPIPDGHPAVSIALSADGNSLWFTQDGTDQIVKFDLTYRAPTLGVTTRDALGNATATVNEGGKVFFAASVTDADSSANDIYAEWDFNGDGVYDAYGLLNEFDGASSAIRVIHTYTESGVYHVTLRVVDGLGQVATQTFDVTVNDVAPTISLLSNLPTDASGNRTITEDSPVSVISYITDPSVVDLQSGVTYAWTVTKNGLPYAAGTGNDNGSGVVGGVGYVRNLFSFTPDAPGTYVVALAFTDKDGSATTSQTIDVVARVPIVQLTDTHVGGGAANYLTPVGSTLYFVNNDGSGQQLWRTDGRPSDTVRVDSGSQGVDPTQLTQVGSWLYFVTDNTDGTYTLWRNDSSTTVIGGTSPSEAIQTFATDPDSLGPYGLTAFGQDLYFGEYTTGTGYELWKTTGAVGGAPQTALFEDLLPGPGSSYPGGTDLIRATSSGIYFSAYNSQDNGWVLWSSDGTPGGTAPVTSGAAGGHLKGSVASAAIGTDLYYISNDAADVYDDTNSLWRIGGPGQTAEMVMSVGGSYPFYTDYDMTAVDGTLYFAKNNSDVTSDSYGVYSIWKCVGSTPSLIIQQSGEFGDVFPMQIVGAGQYVYFNDSNFDDHGDVWRTDGTPEGTELLASIVGTAPVGLTAIGSTLYFVGYTNNDLHLWQSGGTPETTSVVTDVLVSGIRLSYSSNTSYFGVGGYQHDSLGLSPIAAVGSSLYFLADHRDNDFELFRLNNPPVAGADTYTTGQDTALNIPAATGVLANDADPDTADAGHLTASLVSGPSHGTLTFNSDGSFTYTPTAGYVGPDSFTYQASDGFDSSNVATVSLTVLITHAGLQSALDSQPSVDPTTGNPTVTVQAATDAEAGAFLDLFNPNAAGYTPLQPPPGATPETPVDIVVTLPPDYNLTEFTASIPDGIEVRINGGIWHGGSPALTLSSGNLVVTGATFVNSTDAPTILVTGGHLTLRNDVIQESTGFSRAAIRITAGTVDLGTSSAPGGNTLNVNGDGVLVRNLGPNPVSALGNTWEVNGAILTDPYAVEDRIVHALDAGGGGLVTYDAGGVYVTAASGSVQRGIDAVAVGGIVHVQPGQYPRFNLGNKLVTASYQNGPSLGLQSDPLHPGQVLLSVVGTAGDDTIRVHSADNDPDTIRVRFKDEDLGDLKVRGTFAIPIDRIAVYGLAGDDTITVDPDITIPAWLFGGSGDDRLKGGSGSNVLVGGDGDDLLVGGSSRDILIGGRGADRLVGNADDDLLIAGYSLFDADESSLAAILGVWVDPARTYQQRVAALTTTGVGTNQAVKLNALTVSDDGAQDVLTGTSGQDWFLANVSGGGVKDKLTDLSATEFATDLAFINGL